MHIWSKQLYPTLLLGTMPTMDRDPSILTLTCSTSSRCTSVVHAGGKRKRDRGIDTLPVVYLLLICEVQPTNATTTVGLAIEKETLRITKTSY
jgi:hypothetical protein